jgi:hypothetical protein
MCKNLELWERVDGTTKYLCKARGTAYCKLNISRYPDFAIPNEVDCQLFNKEVR